MSKELSQEQVSAVCEALCLPPDRAGQRLALCRAVFDGTAHLHGLTKTARPLLDAAVLGCMPGLDAPLAARRAVLSDVLDRSASPATARQSRRVVGRCIALWTRLAGGRSAAELIEPGAQKASDEIALRLCAILQIGHGIADADGPEARMGGVLDDGEAVELSVTGRDDPVSSAPPGDEMAALWNALMPRSVRIAWRAETDGLWPGLILPYDTVAGAARRILLRQLEQFLSRVYGLRHDWDTEYVHEMRVALRRSRGALRLFRKVMGEGRVAFNDELKWLAGALGAVRDADVFLLFLRRYEARARDEHKPFVDGLIRSIRRGRGEPLAALNEAIGSERFARFRERYPPMLQASVGPGNGLFPETGGRAEMISSRGPELILKQLKKVTQLDRPLGLCSPGELHKLRIRCKRLRYAAEFLGDIYPDGLREIVEPMVDMQDALGDVHDCDIYSERIIRYSEHRKSGRDAVVASAAGAALLDDLSRGRTESLRAAAEVWEKFTKKKALKEVTGWIRSPLEH